MSIIAARSGPAARPLVHGAAVQARVVGALILRELHTRYGRDNIGYLWLFLEPAFLAISVSALHYGHSTASPTQSVSLVSLTLVGYCAFMIFRGVITRSEAVLESNRPLLFHQSVTILDMLVARTLLEAAATLATLAILWTLACAVGLVQPPADLLRVLFSLLLLTWLSFALSLLVCTSVYMSKVAAKILHPLMYLMLPASGAFFILSSLPDPIRRWIGWSPLAQIFEMMHVGQFDGLPMGYYSLPYIIGCCLALTFAGLLAIGIVRRHVHL